MNRIKHIFFILTASIFLKPNRSNAQSKEDLKKKYEKSDLQEEIKKKLQTDNIYPDSVILPPLHYTNTSYILDTQSMPFDSISIDIQIMNDIPDHYNFYISPFNLTLNHIPIYCGIQTHGGGKNINTGKEEGITRNGIFSRWYERTHAALRTTGYYESSDAEGDFIGVRNKVGWAKGKYRITLKKDGYIPGKTLTDTVSTKESYFSWGEFEHTWVTMTVEDLNAKNVYVIGSLAFPGKILQMSEHIGSFTEQYKYFIDFAKKKRNLPFQNSIHYQDLPEVTVIQDNLRLNGRLIILPEVITYHNRTHHPEQSKVNGKMPILSTDQYNPETGELTLKTGKFVSW